MLLGNYNPKEYWEERAKMFGVAKTHILENTSIRNDITSFSLVLKIILKISKPIDLIPFVVPDLILRNYDMAFLFKKVV